ncbi:MAG: tetratricopeptide repeat protein [Oligoflexia bacterium]|nr:tetratricopeptide repeat protein [Oligoflexia bacterium]
MKQWRVWSSCIQGLKQGLLGLKEDVLLRWLLLGGFVYAWVFSQGIPLWDDDFTSWFWKIKDQSLGRTVFELLSPISTQPQYWGFNERPLQALIYKLFHLVSGYEAWSYFLYKSAVYAGLGALVYLWAQRLLPARAANGKLAAAAAAVFLLLAPGPMAAHVIHADLATTAELLFLSLTYFIWAEVERTPTEWSGMPAFSKPERKAWLLRWAGLSFLTYLGYKSKADLKLIPVILGAYILLVRPRQWRYFALPIGMMALLAVPWGKSIFQKLPPFLPGSQGSEIGWMWQPASLGRLRDFLWNPAGTDFLTSLREPSLSLAAILGPFLLLPLAAFVLWRGRGEGLGHRWRAWRRFATPEDRARLFVVIWLAVVLVGISALPALNSIFRVRYGILPLVPVSLLLGWAFGSFAEAANGARQAIPRWVALGAVTLFAVQAGVNLTRSITYRRDLGQVMVAVDQVYEYFARNHAGDKLALFPDFRPYDYRPDAPESIRAKVWLAKPEDLGSREPYKTYAISWKPSLWEKVEVVAQFTGCRESVLFDRVFPCRAGTGAFLMRLIGDDPAYRQGEALRRAGDVAGARKIHEEFVAKHPHSLAGQFVFGLEAYQLKDWAAAQRAYATLERFLPDHLSVLYNHALTLKELGQIQPAIERLRFVTAVEPRNYAALINLYWAYVKAGEEKKARKTLFAMKQAFPEDKEVNRLLASASGK